ncbi:MAG: nucleotidyltransferase domain-containing protein, partial [SAR324 cluster bacterium]|nr:nucleotidyltransferase domain-containing protein [SAR324 cluster bacterium]
GSMARGEASEESDIDFLVKTSASTTPWFPAGLIEDLQGLLGRKVEVVTENALHGYIRDKVLREAVPL